MEDIIIATLLNYDYHNYESLATGFVRPKITALFFDKLWIPGSLLQTSFDFYIPKQLLVQETTEFFVDSMQAGKYYLKSWHRNTRPPSYWALGEITSNQNRDTTCKYSKHRNHAILVSSENFCRLYGIHISPIFHDITDFERDIKTIKIKRTPHRLQLRHKNEYTNQNVLSICIQDYPSIIEESLSWEQVLEVRNDKENTQKLRHFITWSQRVSSKMNPNEIREMLEEELDSYKEALKKYGIKTATGSFSMIVSLASAISSILLESGPVIFPTLTFGAMFLSFLSDAYFTNFEYKNDPIAYLYDVRNI